MRLRMQNGRIRKKAAKFFIQGSKLTTMFDLHAHWSNENLPHGLLYISCCRRHQHAIVHRLLTNHIVEVKARRRSTIRASMSKPYRQDGWDVDRGG